MSAHRADGGVHQVLTEVPTPAQIRRTSLVISVGTWVLTGAVVAVSMSTAAPFIDAHSPGYGTGPVMAVAGDGCFILSLQADSTLSRFGVKPGRWPAVFRWVTGLATVWLNIGAAALEKDLVGVVIHLIPPLLLLLVAEAGPAYRRALARLAQQTRPPLRRQPAPLPRAAREPVNAPLFTLPQPVFTPAPEPAVALSAGPVAAPWTSTPAAPTDAVNTPAPDQVFTTAHPTPTPAQADPTEGLSDPAPAVAESPTETPVSGGPLTRLSEVNTSDTPVNAGEDEAFTDDEGDEQEEPTAVRLDETEAARVIEQCWRDGVSQREAARRSTRAPSYVSKVYKRLADAHAIGSEQVAA
ncbi:hypothetical protein [Kitasatospora sp. NPDC059327]|uniref:hypothetical protein n=1 Tax=Kitasatospora sp. NPDC059327 TaxID=3346803 RepID=UPI0036CDB4D4